MNPSVALLVAYALDRAFGDPPDRFHPVAWMGRAIVVGRDWALREGRVGQLWRGALVAFIIPTASASLAYAALRLVGRWPSATVIATGFLLKPMFAVRGLRDAAYVVRDALDRNDLEAARHGLGSLCSRQAKTLDRQELIAATIESVAENTSDSIVAPLFFFACFGLPGAVFYRAVNTLDAMIGYHGRYEYAGKVAARFDDLLNLLPARLTSLLLLGGGLLAGANVRRGVAILVRDGRRTESPNAGGPMATMAGLLGVRLVKEGAYVLGDEREPLESVQITKAWRIASIASLGAFAAVALACGVLHG
jgi:adenosylcobinamide-phosphate synthase